MSVGAAPADRARAGPSGIVAIAPAGAGRVRIAYLLLALDALALPVWVLWVVGFVGGNAPSVTLQDVDVPVPLALALGPLIVLSYLAVWLAAKLRGYRLALGVALAWVVAAGLALVAGATSPGLVAERLLIAALLYSGRAAFRS